MGQILAHTSLNRAIEILGAKRCVTPGEAALVRERKMPNGIVVGYSETTLNEAEIENRAIFLVFGFGGSISDIERQMFSPFALQKRAPPPLRVKPRYLPGMYLVDFTCDSAGANFYGQELWVRERSRRYVRAGAALVLDTAISLAAVLGKTPLLGRAHWSADVSDISGYQVSVGMVKKHEFVLDHYSRACSGTRLGVCLVRKWDNMP